MNIIGHAEFAKAGEDIVCAGISTLTATLIAAATDEPEFQTSLYVDNDESENDIHRDPHKGYEDKCRAVFNTIYQGYLTIEESYPEYMKVIGGRHG